MHKQTEQFNKQRLQVSAYDKIMGIFLVGTVVTTCPQSRVPTPKNRHQPHCSTVKLLVENASLPNWMINTCKPYNPHKLPVQNKTNLLRMVSFINYIQNMCKPSSVIFYLTLIAHKNKAICTWIYGPSDRKAWLILIFAKQYLISVSKDNFANKLGFYRGPKIPGRLGSATKFPVGSSQVKI